MSLASPMLGPFAVTGTAEEASAFRAATGLPAGEHAALPLTFPMRWLVTPDVRAALSRLAPEPDVVLVHESQTFEYSAPLHVGEHYAMRLSARRKTDPDQIVVDGTIVACDGTPIAALETILRLFSIASA